MATTKDAGGKGTGPQQDNVKETLTAAHEARVSVPGASNVDARLDNRVGAERPPLETFPAVPQHIDGPDIMHQAEHTRRALADRAKQAKKGDDTPRKGMFSPGPHGLSDESIRDSDEPTFGTEGLTAKELAKDDGPKADG